MLKKRKPISSFIGRVLAAAFSLEFLIAAELGDLALCGLCGLIVTLLTTAGFLSVIAHRPEQIALGMAARGHNWLRYFEMITIMQALLLLGWYALAIAYSAVFAMAIVSRMIGTKRLRQMAGSEYGELIAAARSSGQ